MYCCVVFQRDNCAQHMGIEREQTSHQQIGKYHEETAMCTYSLVTLNYCVECRYGDSAVGPVRTLPVMRSFTFLRLIPDMMSPEYQSIWFRFMQQMQQTPLTE